MCHSYNSKLLKKIQRSWSLKVWVKPFVLKCMCTLQTWTLKWIYLTKPSKDMSSVFMSIVYKLLKCILFILKLRNIYIYIVFFHKCYRSWTLVSTHFFNWIISLEGQCISFNGYFAFLKIWIAVQHKKISFIASKHPWGVWLCLWAHAANFNCSIVLTEKAEWLPTLKSCLSSEGALARIIMKILVYTPSLVVS